MDLVLYYHREHGLWQLIPANRQGATLEAHSVDIVNVHFEGRADGTMLVHQCVVKVNGVIWMAETGAKVRHVRLQPLPQTVEVETIRVQGAMK